LAPFLTDYDVYLYCHDTNVVIVCLDNCGTGEELLYAESRTFSPLLFDDDDEKPRESVVWKLKEAVRLAKERLKDNATEVSVYGVLLTEAEILNYFELQDLWDEHSLMVIDELKRLRHRHIKTNDDNELACKAYVGMVTDGTRNLEAIDNSETQEPTGTDDNETVVPDPEYDEFERLLNDFINKGFEVVDETGSGEELLEQDLDEESVEPDDDEDGVDVSFPDDALFPNGEVEQNQNISVKVEVLRPIAHPREELDKLVGCADIKQHMDDLVALTSYNKLMQEHFPHSRKHEVSLHGIFLGQPGTGKTTVCKIYGSLLRQAGALSKGHVVVCNRGTFIGTLWGDEERAVRQVLEMAQGGVLMIDEAYLLNGKHDNDPGKLVIQLLMNILADEAQRDIAVVLCGYKEPMMKLLEMNPGLQSRFSNRFEFTDFTVEELLEITQRRIRSYDYSFTAPAWEKYSSLLAQAYQQRDPENWGNARFIANQLERIYIQHATRCVSHQPQDKQELLMLTPDDILPMEMPRQKKKIGF